MFKEKNYIKIDTYKFIGPGRQEKKKKVLRQLSTLYQLGEIVAIEEGSP